MKRSTFCDETLKKRGEIRGNFVANFARISRRISREFRDEFRNEFCVVFRRVTMGDDDDGKTRYA
jgi:hypothetical protein